MYTHAWLVTISGQGEAEQIHGFSISRAHAESKIAEHRKTFSRSSSRVRVVDWAITEALRHEVQPMPILRRCLWT